MFVNANAKRYFSTTRTVLNDESVDRGIDQTIGQLDGHLYDTTDKLLRDKFYFKRFWIYYRISCTCDLVINPFCIIIKKGGGFTLNFELNGGLQQEIIRG